MTCLALTGLESSLRRIILSRNQLQSIEPYAFQKMEKLEYLDLRGNSALSYIGPGAWGGLGGRMGIEGAPGAQLLMDTSMTALASNCSIQGGSVKCLCARDRFSNKVKEQQSGGTHRVPFFSRLPGGENGECVCPKGQRVWKLGFPTGA